MAETITPQEAFEVQQLYAVYADALHRRDAQAWGETWCSDARWTLPIDDLPDLVGRDAIVGTWSAVMATLPVVIHVPTTPVIVKEGGVLKARWTTRETLVYEDGTAQDLMGIYDDTHRVEDGQLRYQTRKFTVLFRRPLGETAFEILDHPGAL